MTDPFDTVREALESAVMHGKHHDVQLASESLLRENANKALAALAEIKRERDEILAFLVALVNREWGKQTPPYTGSFEQMNQWLPASGKDKP